MHVSICFEEELSFPSIPADILAGDTCLETSVVYRVDLVSTSSPQGNTKVCYAAILLPLFNTLIFLSVISVIRAFSLIICFGNPVSH